MTTAAPYAAATRSKGWRFELDVERVRQSDTWALAPAEARPWLLMLWCEAWTQAPCGSLPADDDVLCARLGIPAKFWAKHRKVLMRGWWKADDGRLYHPTITELVLDMIARRQKGWRRQWPEVMARCGNRCWYCGAAGVEMTLDHVMPRSRGGTDDAANLVPACRSCNSSKGARTPEEWGSQR